MPLFFSRTRKYLTQAKKPTPSEPSCKRNVERSSKQESVRAPVSTTPYFCEGSLSHYSSKKPCPFNATSPSHAFPHAYPPPVRPGSITFVTHIPLPGRGSGREPTTKFDLDLEACVTAFTRLSLGPPSHKMDPGMLPNTPHNARPRTHLTSKLKSKSRLSPSLPRLVSPALDTSVAVSHRPHPKHPSPYPSPITIPRSQNIDIPRSARRKVCPIPYQRPAGRSSTSPESPESSFSRTIRRTPSLVSDHGSEASSPSTPPDFSSMPIPTLTTSGKGSSPEAVSFLEQFLVPHSDWPDIDFGIDVYG